MAIRNQLTGTVALGGSDTINRETGLNMGETLEERYDDYVRSAPVISREQAGMVGEYRQRFQGKAVAALVEYVKRLADRFEVDISDEVAEVAGNVTFHIEIDEKLSAKNAKAQEGVRAATQKRKADAKARLLDSRDNGRKLPTLAAESLEKHLAVIREVAALRIANNDLVTKEASGFIDVLESTGFVDALAEAVQEYHATEFGDDATLAQVRAHDAVWSEARPLLMFAWPEIQEGISGGVTETEKRWVRRQVRDFTKLGRTTLPTIEELRAETWSKSVALSSTILTGDDIEAQLAEERERAEIEAAESARARLQKPALTTEEKAAHAGRSPEEQERIDSFIASRMAAVEDKQTNQEVE